MVHKRKFTGHGFGTCKYIVILHRCLFKANLTLALNPLHMLFLRQNLQMFLYSFSIAT